MECDTKIGNDYVLSYIITKLNGIGKNITISFTKGETQKNVILTDIKSSGLILRLRILLYMIHRIENFSNVKIIVEKYMKEKIHEILTVKHQKEIKTKSEITEFEMLSTNICNLIANKKLEIEFIEKEKR
jgi:hypothetical protein